MNGYSLSILLFDSRMHFVFEAFCLTIDYHLIVTIFILLLPLIINSHRSSVDSQVVDSHVLIIIGYGLVDIPFYILQYRLKL